MKKEILYEIKGLYRDDFRVTGFSFGSGEKSVCIVGSLRGNEYQQIYACSKLIEEFKSLEENGKIKDGTEILVIPCANPYSVNIKKRFWTIDNTDINRMFPGYNLGETTQRIADGIFKVVKDYKFGIQFASFYMSGNFVPQVRMMKTGRENTELAKDFSLPFIVLHNPRPFDDDFELQLADLGDRRLFNLHDQHERGGQKKRVTGKRSGFKFPRKARLD